MMDEWIKHAQIYFVSGYNNKHALKTAIEHCQDQRICKFLGNLSLQGEVEKKEARALEQSLVEGTPRLIVHLFNNVKMIVSIQSPLQIIPIQRESIVSFVNSLAHKTSRHKLYPISSMLFGFLGFGLSIMGAWSASRAAYEEALPICRTLAETDSDNYLLSLARTLNNYGNLLTDVDEFEAARKAYEEALRVYRDLEKIKPDTYLPNIARCLNNLGTLMSNLRDFAAARNAYEEALPIYHTLIKVDSGAGMTMALSNLGNLLRDMDELEAARTAYEEALSTYRTLTVTNPGAYFPNLAMTLNNFGILLRNLRDFEAARKAYEEALNVYRTLDEDAPGVYLSNKAMSLNNLGNLLSDFPDSVEARRAAYEEALFIRRTLSATDPDVYLSELAGTLNNLGSFLNDLRDFQGSRAAFKEAIAIAESEVNSSEFLHLFKNSAVSAYGFLLEDAASGAVNTDKAFALCAALRDAQACATRIGHNELIKAQQWLADQSKAGCVTFQILVANTGPSGAPVLGLIDNQHSQFFHLKKTDIKWESMFPTKKKDANPKEQWKLHVQDSIKRQHLARELWCALPKEIQSALIPEDNKAKFTIISGDPFWNAFPWELLRFADGEKDYLGLHQTLPRIGALQAKDLDVQLSLKQLGSGAGTITILAPHDTGRVPLEKVIDEVEAVKQAINERGGNVVGYALGSDANDVSIKKQIELRPDIVYYSGHGKVIQNEEVLVLHDARFELCKLSYFGKEHLEDIAQLSGCDVFLQRPLIVLNSCHTGRSRTFGGAREDFVSALLLQGAGAVISTALPIYEDVGKALGEALFAPNLPENSDIATIVLQARQSLARDLCENIKTPFWGAWGMIHLHGNALAKLSFNHYKV